MVAVKDKLHLSPDSTYFYQWDLRMNINQRDKDELILGIFSIM